MVIKMALTIYDISQKAGVSTATVSRVLNGSGNVSPSTQKKVMAVIEKYDYIPNAFARGMGLRSLQTVGILCADSSDLFASKAIYLLEQELQANGYEALLCCTGYNLGVKKNYLNLILSKKVDSIILVGSNFIAPSQLENEYIAEAAAQVPIMLLNASYNHPNVYSILCDDYNAMYEATSAMIDSGISDILYLYNSESYSGMKKLKGFQDAWKERIPRGFSNNICHYTGKPDSMEEIADFVAKTAAKGVPIHGIIAADDCLAIGAMKYAQHKGLRIPEDISVIGYNNSVLTGCCSPELTSVDNCLEMQTHQLVQTLLHVIAGEEVANKIIFSGKLVKRSTTRF
ncbi:MAG: LacI family transcriptional regulator [Bacillus sp. (in: Bacteria)]|nr:LacI family transcriptional regulator [Bacillus sp. (in: firmicutes)]MCM1427728.1 LacI family transcriptional regulator [Eubacterium sp.]